MWWLLIAGFVWWSLRRVTPGEPVPGSIEQLARAAAAAEGIDPVWLLATADVESGMRAEPRRYGDMGRPAWRPYGMSLVAARDEWPGLSDVELVARLDDLAEQTNGVARRLARYVRRYDAQADVVRVAWAWGPGTAARVASGELPLDELVDSTGEAYPVRAGVRWRAALDRWA